MRTTDLWLARLDFKEIFLGSLREAIGEDGDAAANGTTYAVSGTASAASPSEAPDAAPADATASATVLASAAPATSQPTMTTSPEAEG